MLVPSFEDETLDRTLSLFVNDVFAKEHGFLRITLLVDADNPTAQRFYEGIGYEYSNMKCMRVNVMKHLFKPEFRK
ncbi:hypothetical protein D3C74_197470 [compost metagenome]